MQLFIILTAFLFVAGCAEVKPWERNILAQERMQLVPDEIEAFTDEHIYFSKEAATGGRSVGGGGCGCN